MLRSKVNLLAATMRAGSLGPSELQLDAHHVAADRLVRPARLAQRIALQEAERLVLCRP